MRQYLPVTVGAPTSVHQVLVTVHAPHAVRLVDAVIVSVASVVPLNVRFGLVVNTSMLLV